MTSSHHRRELVPRLGDLAADEDLRGVERVDDHRQAAAQMARGFLERGDGARLAGARARDDVGDREPGFVQQPRVSVGENSWPR